MCGCTLLWGGYTCHHAGWMLSVTKLCWFQHHGMYMLITKASVKQRSMRVDEGWNSRSHNLTFINCELAQNFSLQCYTHGHIQSIEKTPMQTSLLNSHPRLPRSYLFCSRWKDPENEFRKHPQFKLTGIPTLIKWKTVSTPFAKITPTKTCPHPWNFAPPSLPPFPPPSPPHSCPPHPEKLTIVATIVLPCLLSTCTMLFCLDRLTVLAQMTARNKI
jgi:hypothetical protein